MSVDQLVNKAQPPATINTLQMTTDSQITSRSEGTLIQKGSGLQVVIGLGQSGLATVNYLVQQGYNVAITDAHPNPPLASKLPDSVAIRIFGTLDAQLLQRAARIIISPGVPLTTPAVAAAKQAGIAIVSDIQLFKDACTVPIIAITGSNAKTTVTTLVGQMAKDAGIKVGVGGNIGVPALSLLDAGSDALELAVLELSSFQLETVTNLGAKVAVVLNMSPDHLDRHGDMLGYHQVKHRIFQGAKSIVVNRDDALTRPLVADNIPRLSIGSNAPDMGEYGLLVDGDSKDNGRLYLAKGTQKLLAADAMRIKGKHNLLNAQAALAIGELAGLPLDSMLATLKAFAGLPHRCQFVATIADVDYFNDSKGTNVGSTKAAILGLGSVYQAQNGNRNGTKNKLLLIMGGQGKGQDFGELVPLINRYVSQVLLIGADAKKIAADFKQAQPEPIADTVEMHQCKTLTQALQKAQTLTQSSLSQVAAVVLSPACASFDQFSGYVARGEQFCEWVRAPLTAPTVTPHPL